MSIQAKLLLWLASLVAVGSVLFAAFNYGRHIEGLERDKQQSKAVEKQQYDDMKTVLAYAERIKQGVEQHDKDQLTINRLGRDLNGMRVHIPSVCAEAGTAKASQGADGAAGILSSGVDAAFAKLQSGVGALVQRCDQLNIDARQANEVSR